MFSKIIIALSTVVAVAVAGGAPGSVSQCNTGNTQCCNQLAQTGSAQANDLLANIVGVDVGALTGTLGLQCNPITVIGGAISPNCAQQPVCCEGNTANGLVNVGCVPISV